MSDPQAIADRVEIEALRGEFTRCDASKAHARVVRTLGLSIGAR
jgi:hypothetical protein